jgi:hypothetical protein
MDNGKLRFVFRMALGLVVAAVSFILGIHWIRETVQDASTILRETGTQVDLLEMIQDICFIPMKVMCATIACYFGLLLAAVNVLDYIFHKGSAPVSRGHQTDVDSVVCAQDNELCQIGTLNEEVFLYHYFNQYRYDHYNFNMASPVWDDPYMADPYIGLPDKMACLEDYPYMDTPDVAAPSSDSSYTDIPMSLSCLYLPAISGQYVADK